VITQVNFSAKIINASGDPDNSERMLNLEYYDSINFQWTNLFGPVGYNNGAYFASLDLNTSVEEWARFGKIIDAGFFPAIRLVDADSAKLTITKVLAFGGNIDLTNGAVLSKGEFLIAASKSTKATKASKIAKTTKAKTVANKKITATKASEANIRIKLDAFIVDFDDLWLVSPDQEDQLVQQAQALGKKFALIAGNKEPGKGGNVDALLQQIQNQNTQIASLQTSNQSFMTQVVTLQSTVQTQTGQIATLNATVQTKTAQITTLTSQVQTHLATIQTLQARIAALEATQSGQRTQEANKVYTNVVSEITKAAESLSNSNYKLSNLALDLKVLVKNDENGLRLQLVDDTLAETISGDSLSNIRIEVKANESGNTNTVVNPLPSILGLTESQARKKLLNYGLKLNPIYQFSDAHTLGQAFKQYPEANTELMEGSVITVIFAKDKNKYN
jgi:hypothetical protein